MSNETTEIAPIVDAMTTTDGQNEKLTPQGVVLLAMATVGAFVVTKKATKFVSQRMEVRREMKKLYKESKKSA